MVFHLFFQFRCCKRERIEGSLWTKLKFTLLDRLRIPWIGGAIRVPPSSLLAAIIVPSFVYLGALSLISSIVNYIIVLPTLFYVIVRAIRENLRQNHLSSYHSKSLFYPSYALSTICWLYFFLVFYIIDHIKINGLEGFVLCSLCGLAFGCLHICRKKASLNFQVDSEAEVGCYMNFINNQMASQLLSLVKLDQFFIFILSFILVFFLLYDLLD